MSKITFEQLPEAIENVSIQVAEIKTILTGLLNKIESCGSRSHDWMDLEELVKYDPEKRAKSTFYNYCQNGLIPFHKRGKKLLFLKKEVDSWLLETKCKSKTEINEEVDSLIRNRKLK